MSNKPDKWVVVKITNGKEEPIYKVLASWYGGYTGSDSWRMNSGITEVKDNEHHLSFYGYSGSIYECGKQLYGMSSLANGVLSSMTKKIEDGEIYATIELMPEDTDWLNLIPIKAK